MRHVSLEGRLDGVTNMSRDVALLSQVESGVCRARVYGWDGPWVSLGRSQQPERALLHPDLVPHVKRPTGGKGVLHGHDVTVGLAAQLADLGLDSSQTRSVAPAYRAIVRILVNALQGAGVLAELGEKTRFVKDAGHTADCFAHVAPNDIVNPLTGAKICGCALQLTSTAVLVQASIPASRPLIDPREVFANPAPVTWSEIDAASFAESLEAELDRTASISTSVP